MDANEASDSWSLFEVELFLRENSFH